MSAQSNLLPAIAGVALSAFTAAKTAVESKSGESAFSSVLAGALKEEVATDTPAAPAESLAQYAMNHGFSGENIGGLLYFAQYQADSSNEAVITAFNKVPTPEPAVYGVGGFGPYPGVVYDMSAASAPTAVPPAATASTGSAPLPLPPSVSTGTGADPTVATAQAPVQARSLSSNDWNYYMRHPETWSRVEGDRLFISQSINSYGPGGKNYTTDWSDASYNGVFKA